MTNWSHSSTNQLEAESERIAAELERRRIEHAPLSASLIRRALIFRSLQDKRVSVVLLNLSILLARERDAAEV